MFIETSTIAVLNMFENFGMLRLKDESIEIPSTDLLKFSKFQTTVDLSSSLV